MCRRRIKTIKMPKKDLIENLMFEPIAKECVPKKKLALPGLCNNYRECTLNKTASYIEQWTILKCPTLLHFDPKSQQCVHSNYSSCGNV